MCSEEVDVDFAHAMGLVTNGAQTDKSTPFFFHAVVFSVWVAKHPCIGDRGNARDNRDLELNNRAGVAVSDASVIRDYPGANSSQYQPDT
jgi:hypothetical protein